MSEEESQQELLDLLAKGERDFQEGCISDCDSVYDRVDKTLISTVKNGLHHSKSSTSERYYKPSMTDLPPEIGIPIFEQIITAPKANTRELDRIVAELRERILSESDEEDK